YRLSADMVKAGCTIRELVEYRRAAGTFFDADAETYTANVLRLFANRQPGRETLGLLDGRIITVISQPTEGGGWGAPHEDVTERHRLLIAQRQAEEELRAQHVRLDAALNSMRQGLLMFDADSRLILYNDRYLKMYGLSPDAAKPGCTLRDLLIARKATGTFKGDPDQYMKTLVDHGKVETKVVDLPDGRTVSVTNAPVKGGGWVSTHDDVTERRRAERELDQTRVFLNTVIENVPA